MGREKKDGPGVPSGHHAKDRHRRDRKGVLHDWTGPMPRGLVARPQIAQPKTKHHSYFEFVENKDKKKKLEFQITTNKHPPPGFEFVPIGNPALTTACKELSRSQDAMIFIVSASKGGDSKELSLALNRVGHHVRQTIVEQARESLGDLEYLPLAGNPGIPEPIPEDQEEINNQADAAIKDLFPRIPNGDRQTIIQHSFKKGATMNGMRLVGLAPDITLSRRVQLAVLAHIRHTHTRYDQLLRETTYVNARKAVESLCLDILVKWRGDEETGRDQLDEILREVVVISDSEDDEYEDDEDESEESESSEASSIQELAPADRLKPALAIASPQEPLNTQGPLNPQSPSVLVNAGHAKDRAVQVPESRRLTKEAREEKRAARKAHRGFLRYQAVRDQVWHKAVERQQLGAREPASPAAQVSTVRPTSNVLQTYHARPSSYGLPYPAYHAQIPYDDAEYLPRNGNPRTVVTSHPQYLARDGRTGGSASFNSFGAVVGSRVNALEPPTASRSVVSHRDESLKDCLVRSIESRSPETSHFSYQPSRLPRLSEPQHSEHLSARLAVPVARPAWRSAAPDSYGEEFLDERRMVDDQRDFIRVQASRESNGIPTSSAGYSVSRAPTTYFGVPSVAYPVAGPFNAAHRQSPATHYRSSTLAEDDGFLRQESNRVMVEDEGTRHAATFRRDSRPMLVDDRESQLRSVRREELRPISFGDYGMRPELEGRAVGQPQPYAVYRDRTTPADHGIIELRRHPHDQLRGHADPRFASPYSDRARGGDVERHMPVDFIPVSNVFPRPHVAPASKDYSWPPPKDIHSRYGDGLGEPSHLREYTRGASQSLGARVNLPREERVVRVEYVDHSYPNRDYEQRVRPHEHEHIYQQRNNSSVPVSFADDDHCIPPEQKRSAQDGVIYIS